MDILLDLERAGLDCVGARVVGGGELELRVTPRGPATVAGEAVSRAFPGRISHMLWERLPEGTRARTQVTPGVWVSWRESGPLAEVGAPAHDRERLLAFEVAKGDGGADEEVVMAASPDEAATYYAQGWGLPQGALVSVAWEDRSGTRHPALPARQTRFYRVIGAGRVATLPG